MTAVEVGKEGGHNEGKEEIRVVSEEGVMSEWGEMKSVTWKFLDIYGKQNEKKILKLKIRFK